MRIQNYVRQAFLACVLMSAPCAVSSSKTIQNDTFIKTETVVPPEGTSDSTALIKAPSPFLHVRGEEKTAKIVVDLNTNILYKYDNTGQAEAAYLVASGKKSSSTDKGVRIVTHIEKYPYKSAPASTRRHKKPNDYGPNILCLNKLDTITGKQSPTGEFIHGNNNPSSLGKYASLGCIRMDNNVIKEFAKEIKRGDIIIIQ